MARKTDPTAPALSYLMEQAQKGDQNAYRQVMESLLSPLRQYIQKRISNTGQSEDILQNTLLAIHQNRHTYRPNSPLMPWVYGIARYKLMDYLRQHYRKDQHNVHQETSEGLDHVIETSSPVDTNNHDKVEIKQDLDVALNTLSSKQQEIVTASKIDGHSIKDIAQEQNMSESAVKVTIHRAIAKMQDYMGGKK